VVNTELAGGLAEAHSDSVLQHVHFSLDEDARWHLALSWTLLRASIDDRPENKDVVDQWIHHWRPLARDALEALASVMTTAPKPADGERVVENVANAAEQETAALLEPPPTPTSLDHQRDPGVVPGGIPGVVLGVLRAMMKDGTPEESASQRSGRTKQVREKSAGRRETTVISA